MKKEGNIMIEFKVLCIKDYEYEGVTFWRKGMFYFVKGCNEFRKAYRISLNQGEQLCPYNKFSEHFEKVPTNVHLVFNADFSTDGDFHFDETRLKELDVKCSLYNGATIQYNYERDWEDIHFCLTADGKSDACRYALRDLLEEMIASFRTYSSKYYLIKDVYDLLEGFLEAIWENNEIKREDSMGGNYDGTYVYLKIKELPDEKIQEEDDIVDHEDALKSNWVEVVIDGEAKLQCPHCESVHPDVPYVRGFKHCPICGEVL